MTLSGLELSANSPGNPALRQHGGAESGALLTLDPDLARVVDAWATLAEPIRRAVLSLLGTVAGGT